MDKSNNAGISDMTQRIYKCFFLAESEHSYSNKEEKSYVKVAKMSNENE